MLWLYALWAMGRPYFLLGIVPLYFLGAALAWRNGSGVSPGRLVGGMVMVWFVQLVTHYNNEFRDLETDRATQRPTRFSGGSRVLVKGLVPLQWAFRASVICLFLALGVVGGLVLGLGAGLWSIALAVVGLFLGWFYSSPPLKLEGKGLGGVTIAFIAALLVPSTGYYLQAATLSPRLLVTGLPLFFLSLAATLATEIPDRAADEATGKKTLVVRLGRGKAVAFHNLCLVLGFGFLALPLSLGIPSWSLAPLLGSAPFVFVSLVSGYISSDDASAEERVCLMDTLALGWASLSLLALFLR